jgi:hypothetical protein
MTKDARDQAVLRLDQALAEEERTSVRNRAAVGTAGEFSAHAQWRAASEDVEARRAWLKSIDDDRPGGGRVWINGREVGGPNSRFLGLDESYD